MVVAGPDLTFAGIRMAGDAMDSLASRHAMASSSQRAVSQQPPVGVGIVEANRGRSGGAGPGLSHSCDFILAQG